MKKWSPDERALLAEARNDGLDWEDCAYLLSRSVQACRSFAIREKFYTPDTSKNPHVAANTAWRLQRKAEAKAWGEAWRAQN